MQGYIAFKRYCEMCISQLFSDLINTSMTLHIMSHQFTVVSLEVGVEMSSEREGVHLIGERQN